MFRLLLIGFIALTARIASAKPNDTRESLRDQARLILESHCGQCHIGAYSTSVPRALAVYNLSELEWSARMTDLQLKDALDRLSQPPPDDGRPKEISANQRERFARFVDVELKRRAARK